MLSVEIYFVTKLIISITVIGEADEDEIVYRNGAKQTDLLVVTGDIGAAYTTSFRAREAGFQVNPNSQPDLDSYLFNRASTETGSSKRRSYFIACLRNKTNSND
jgi:thiamine monophosphate kinase